MLGGPNRTIVVAFFKHLDQCCRNFRAKWTIVVAVFAHGGASVVAVYYLRLRCFCRPHGSLAWRVPAFLLPVCAARLLAEAPGLPRRCRL